MPAEAALQLGLIGAGWAGREHGDSVRRLGDARVVAVADVSAGAAGALAAELGAAVCPDADALLGLEGLDAVIIATPSGAHRDPAVAALERGLGVFLEKPLARTVEDAHAIVDAAQRSGAVCAVGYQWRALELLDRLRAGLAEHAVALLVSQGIGVTQARAWWRDPHLGGGLIFERASHHLDLQRAVAGPVATVQAAAGTVALSGRPPEGSDSHDVVSLTLGYASGAVGAVHVGWTPEGYHGRQSLSVFATGRAFELALDPRFALQVDGGPAERATEPPFRRQMRRFLDALRRRDPGAVACTPQEAAATVVTAAGAERSLATGSVVAV